MPTTWRAPPGCQVVIRRWSAGRTRRSSGPIVAAQPASCMRRLARTGPDAALPHDVLNRLFVRIEQRRNESRRHRADVEPDALPHREDRLQSTPLFGGDDLLDAEHLLQFQGTCHQPVRRRRQAAADVVESARHRSASSRRRCPRSRTRGRRRALHPGPTPPRGGASRQAAARSAC